MQRPGFIRSLTLNALRRVKAAGQQHTPWRSGWFQCPGCQLVPQWCSPWGASSWTKGVSRPSLVMVHCYTGRHELPGLGKKLHFRLSLPNTTTWDFFFTFQKPSNVGFLLPGANPADLSLRYNVAAFSCLLTCPSVERRASSHLFHQSMAWVSDTGHHCGAKVQAGCCLPFTPSVTPQH